RRQRHRHAALPGRLAPRRRPLGTEPGTGRLRPRDQRAGLHHQGLAVGVRDDVGALDAAAAAHRPGDDDLHQVPGAAHVRAAAGRQPVAPVRAAVGDEGRPVDAGGRVRAVHAAGLRAPGQPQGAAADGAHAGRLAGGAVGGFNRRPVANCWYSVLRTEYGVRSTGIMGLHTFLFWTVALLTGLCAFAVLLSQNIVRAAAWLLFTLLGTAGIYFLLGADFVGATQLIVYVGGILVLVVFGVMLTAQGPFISMKTGAAEWAISGLAGLGLFAVLAVSIVLVFARWRVARRPGEPPPARPPSAVVLGEAFLALRGATPEATLPLPTRPVPPPALKDREAEPTPLSPEDLARRAAEAAGGG